MTLTAVKTPKQILLDAAAILEEEGKWMQGEWHEACETAPDGISHCADGALTVAAGITTLTVTRTEDGELQLTQHHLLRDGDTEPLYEAYEAAYDEASSYVRTLHAGTGGIVHYNDADGRKQQEVVAALRGAAQAL